MPHCGNPAKMGGHNDPGIQNSLPVIIPLYKLHGHLKCFPCGRRHDMQILAVADTESEYIWDHLTHQGLRGLI